MKSMQLYQNPTDQRTEILFWKLEVWDKIKHEQINF